MKLNLKSIVIGAAALLAVQSAFAQEAARKETVGVDVHYEYRDHNETWSGTLSYARLIMNNFEVAVGYTFEGADQGAGTTQGLQLLGRQWFGSRGKANSVVPFVEGGVGMEFQDSHYENAYVVGAGAGMFVSEQSELRLTLKHIGGGFDNVTRGDIGFYYHF